MKKGESEYQVFYVPLGTSKKGRTVQILELTEKKSTIPNTAILADGNAYTVSIDKPRMSIKPGSAAQRVTVTNTRVKEEDQKKADQAVLKLTKKVQYKKAPIRVNAVYYIGIFDDANLTKLRYKRALQFRNASEVTATLKINLYKLASKEVTFYFAETDRNGKPVTGGKAVGYDIEQNKKGITLNASNPEDELVITNSVIEGTKREKILLDPSSGFAGDRAALAEAQERENSGNDSAVTTTGDTSPLLQWSTALVGSMMVLILYPLLTAQRRRRRRR